MTKPKPNLRRDLKKLVKEWEAIEIDQARIDRDLRRILNRHKARARGKR